MLLFFPLRFLLEHFCSGSDRNTFRGNTDSQVVSQKNIPLRRKHPRITGGVSQLSGVRNRCDHVRHETDVDGLTHPTHLTGVVQINPSVSIGVDQDFKNYFREFGWSSKLINPRNASGALALNTGMSAGCLIFAHWLSSKGRRGKAIATVVNIFKGSGNLRGGLSWRGASDRIYRLPYVAIVPPEDRHWH